MRAGIPALLRVLLLTSGCLVLCQQQQKGYQPEAPYQEEVLDVVDNITALCPTDRLLRARDTCNVDGADVQCIQLRCCDGFVFIAGRCIPASVDPCSLQLCEQSCEVRGSDVWCTCHPGFSFHQDHYQRRTQPYCVDVDECLSNNGGCEQRCVNDPGGHHCVCAPPMTLAADGRRCQPLLLPAPLPLIRASSRCFAPCDTVSWLSRRVKQLSDQLLATQQTLRKVLEHPLIKGDDGGYAEGSSAYRVLDSTAQLEGGYCRCERGPRGPPGAPGMEGPKGNDGPRGPRGPRGPHGSLDLMLLLLADIRHDITNLEAKVYKDGEHPERFNLQKAWKRQRKQEKLEMESKSEQNLEAFTEAPVVVTEEKIHITTRGRTGEITHETDSPSDWTLVKGEPEPTPSDLPLGLPADVADKLREFQLLANETMDDDEEDLDADYDYSFY